MKSRSDVNVMERYLLKQTGKVLVEGRSIGQRIGAGKVRIVTNIKEMDESAGDVLVTDMTDPDWEPVMKRAAAIITNRGGRTVTPRLSPASWVCLRLWVVAMPPMSSRTVWK